MSNITKDKKADGVWEDVWVKTMCRRCQSECAIKVHRVNGVAVKIEGIEESACGSEGGVCAKGLAGLQLLYDPNRLNYPMKRTNSEKGIGVDPKWERISWDEAYTTIAEKLEAALEKSPERIMIQFGIVAGMQQPKLFCSPMIVGLADDRGAPIAINAAGATCGNAGHFVNGLNYSAFVIAPDYENCKYLIVFGTNHSFGGFQQYANEGAAEARRKGMKVVVFDPVNNRSANAADEWVPIKPGTDIAACNAMSHVIVNELGKFDAPYLKKKTNAPYLIKKDGHYMRDGATNKPMIWDEQAQEAKVFDDPTIGDFALDGKFEVNGEECVTAWQLLKANFAQCTPEDAAEICGVPAETLRRIATEYVEAACIGATVEIDGHTLPYRPVSTLNIRALSTHGNGAQAIAACEMLHQIVGCANAVGGCTDVANEMHGYPYTEDAHLEKMETGPCPDGFVSTTGAWPFPEHVWPLPEYGKPKQSMDELFPCALEVPILRMCDRDEVWENAGLGMDIDVIINCSTNALMNASNPNERATFYKRVPFIVDIDIFSNEFNEAFADIVLPDASYLEKNDWEGMDMYFHGICPGMKRPFSMHIAQEVIPPMYERMYHPEFINELFYRMGRGDRMVDYYNHMVGLDEEHALPHGERIDWLDLCNRAVTWKFGQEHDWDWFKEHGGIHWPKTVEENYWRQFRDVRVQVYWEFLIDQKEKTKRIADEIGLSDKLRWDEFTPVPIWHPIRPMECEDEDFDLYAFTFAEPQHSTSNTQEQPWLDEVSSLDEYTYGIRISAETARRKGLKDGDQVEVTEYFGGRSITGRLAVSEGMRSDTLTIIAIAGHWAKGLPIARGKGSHFNSLITVAFGDCDPVSMNTEPCLKVRVRKAS